MAKRKVLKIGEATLRKKCKPVKDFDDDLAEFLDDMRETMYDNDGMGLAAPQVGVLRRAVIVEVNNMFLELINPEIVEMRGETIEEEGCLSVPGLYAPVTRPSRIVFRGTTLDGETLEYECAGLLARMIQHELDHLDGICFVDRLTDDVAKKYKKDINAVLRNGKRTDYKKIVII